MTKLLKQTLAQVSYTAGGFQIQNLCHIAVNDISQDVSLKLLLTGRFLLLFVDFVTHTPEIHSPREIISTMCKTGQDALRKWKPCRKLFIHSSNKSASNTLKNVSMESLKLLCFSGISFCSKSCKLKTFPLSIASVLTLVVDGPR